MFLATESGDKEAVELLLKTGLSVTHVINGKIAADIAYEKGHFDVLLVLLNANSRFPRNFESKELPEKLQEFLNVSNSLRNSILNENKEEIYEILKSISSLKYFYDTKNESILTFSIIKRKFDIYEILIGKNLFFGPREDIDDIMDRLSLNQQRKIRNIHLKNSKRISEKHLMILMANSSVSHEETNVSEKLSYVFKAYEFLNEISNIKPILKAVAASKDFEIHFDFNREFVRYLDPTSEPYTNGLFQLCGRVLIGARLMLNPETENEAFAVLAHEMCHFAMCLVYDNLGNPYFKNNSKTIQIFEDISEQCKAIHGLEPLIDVIYEEYPEEMIHPELIVRSPHMLAHYHGNEEKFAEVYENFRPLHDFYENTVIPEIERAIPGIENKALDAYKKAKEKISTLRKLILILIILIAIGGPSLYFYLNTPTFVWKNLTDEDKSKIYNSTLNFHGLNLRVDELFANDSEIFDLLSSEQISQTLNGDLQLIESAVEGYYFQYIYLVPSNLTMNIWNKIFNSEINFQGQKVEFGEIVSNSSALLNLTSRDIKKLIKNESIEIGNNLNFEFPFFVQRNFLDAENILNSTDVFNLIESENIFLLSDLPGSGKSVVFQNMAIEIKEIYPNKWIFYLELKNLIKEFKEIENDEFKNEKDVAICLSSKILKFNNFEGDIFIDQFVNDKIVFFWDALDEIYPLYDDIFISLAFKIYNYTKNSQFISTRFQFVDKLEKKFKSNHFSLLPYSKTDRNYFLNNFLAFKNLTKLSETVIKVETFIEDILSGSSKTLKQDINNPLMLKMISEIAIDKKLSPDLKNIYKIYDVFVTMKLDLLDEKGDLVRKQSRVALLDIGINEVHEFYALRAIFGDNFFNHLKRKNVILNSLNIMNRNVTWMDDQISLYSIMTIKADKSIDFVHRTFAEYFIAKYLIHNIYYINYDPSHDEMSKRIALLHNVAYNFKVYKVIQNFLLDFLTIDSDIKKFSPAVIEVMKTDFGTYEDFFSLDLAAQVFLKFFEKDDRVMKILARIDKFKNNQDWIKFELGIDKNQNSLGLELITIWQFQKRGNEIFVDFLSKELKINCDDPKIKSITTAIAEINYSKKCLKNLNFLKTFSEFFTFISSFLSIQQQKEILINSVRLIDDDFQSKDEANFLLNKFKKILNNEEIAQTLKMRDSKNRTLFFKTSQIENEDFNTEILNLMSQNLKNDEIYELLTLQDTVYKSTASMATAQNQDGYFIETFINFLFNHTTTDQFRSILLQRDGENDTMLQYSHFHPYPDNFYIISKIYSINIPVNEIQETFLNRKKFTFPSFADVFVAANRVEVFKEVAIFLRSVFTGAEKN